MNRGSPPISSNWEIPGQTFARLLTAAVVTAALISCVPAPPTPPVSLTIQLRWLHQAQFAGFYAAEANGYYAEEQIQVEFIPGGPAVDIHAAVLEGRAEFGVAGAETLIARRAAGQPLKAIATIYRRNPLVFAALAESGITEPQDFTGKSIALSSFNSFVLHAMTNRVGLAPNAYTEICCEFSMLYTGEADVANAFLTNDVIAAEQAGHKLNIIYPDDYGVHFYADTLYTTDEYIAADPDLVLRFLRASLKGWTYAVENPAAVPALVAKYNPDADPDHQLAEITASLPLINTGEDFIGWMKAEVWAGMEQTLQAQNVISTAVRVQDAFTLQFLEGIYHR